MVDQFPDQCDGDAAIQDDGVPVRLVHVVSRHDRSIGFAEFEGPFGVAFGVELHRMAVEGDQQEGLAPDLEYQDIGAEGEAFLHFGLGEGMVAYQVE